MSIKGQAGKLLHDILSSMGFVRTRSKFRKIRTVPEQRVVEVAPPLDLDDEGFSEKDPGTDAKALFSSFIAEQAKKSTGRKKSKAHLQK
jgi:hypothetical protein